MWLNGDTEQQHNASSSSSHETVLCHQLEQCRVLADDKEVPKKQTTRVKNKSAILRATTRLYNDSSGEFKDFNHTRGSLYRQQQQQPGQKWRLSSRGSSRPAAYVRHKYHLNLVLHVRHWIQLLQNVILLHVTRRWTNTDHTSWYRSVKCISAHGVCTACTRMIFISFHLHKHLPRNVSIHNKMVGRWWGRSRKNNEFNVRTW